MQNSKDYKLKIVNEDNKLVKIHELAYGNYFINNNKKDPNLFPGFDKSNDTKIIVAEINDNIIGTNSITVDGDLGLPSDKYFKAETNLVRSTTKGLVGNSWKIAISQQYKCNIGVLFDLIQKTVELAVDMDIESCLYIFPKKHENVYKKFIKAETISEKKCNIGDKKDVHLVLMKTDTKETVEHLNQLFTNRKF